MPEWDQIEGKAKDLLGEATGDTSTEVEGHAQETLGDVKDAGDNLVDDVTDAAGELRDRLS